MYRCFKLGTETLDDGILIDRQLRVYQDGDKDLNIDLYRKPVDLTKDNRVVDTENCELHGILLVANSSRDRDSVKALVKVLSEWLDSVG